MLVSNMVVAQSNKDENEVPAVNENQVVNDSASKKE
jgi:hypothetical protein